MAATRKQDKVKLVNLGSLERQSTYCKAEGIDVNYPARGARNSDYRLNPYNSPRRSSFKSRESSIERKGCTGGTFDFWRGSGRTPVNPSIAGQCAAAG